MQQLRGRMACQILHSGIQQFDQHHPRPVAVPVVGTDDLVIEPLEVDGHEIDCDTDWQVLIEYFCQCHHGYLQPVDDMIRVPVLLVRFLLREGIERRLVVDGRTDVSPRNWHRRWLKHDS